MESLHNHVQHLCYWRLPKQLKLSKIQFRERKQFFFAKRSPPSSLWTITACRDVCCFSASVAAEALQGLSTDSNKEVWCHSLIQVRIHLFVTQVTLRQLTSWSHLLSHLSSSDVLHSHYHKVITIKKCSLAEPQSGLFTDVYMKRFFPFLVSSPQ